MSLCSCAAHSLPVPAAPDLIECSDEALQECEGLVDPSGNHMWDMATDDAVIISEYELCKKRHTALIGCHKLQQEAISQMQANP